MKKAYITKLHIFVEIISFVLMLGAILLCVWFIQTVDGKVPTHFDLAGNIDGYGSPSSLLAIPITMLLTNLGLLLILHKLPPELWNLPFRLNLQNAIFVFRDLAWMIVFMELEISAWTLAMTICSIQANGRAMTALMVILTVLTFLTILLCVLAAARDNRR